MILQLYHILASTQLGKLPHWWPVKKGLKLAVSVVVTVQTGLVVTATNNKIILNNQKTMDRVTKSHLYTNIANAT